MTRRPRPGTHVQTGGSRAHRRELSNSVVMDARRIVPAQQASRRNEKRQGEMDIVRGRGVDRVIAEPSAEGRPAEADRERADAADDFAWSEMMGPTEVSPVTSTGPGNRHPESRCPAGSKSSPKSSGVRVRPESPTPKSCLLQKFESKNMTHEVGGRGEFHGRALRRPHSCRMLFAFVPTLLYYRLARLASSPKNGGRLEPGPQKDRPRCAMLGTDSSTERQVYRSDRRAHTGPLPKLVQRWMRSAGRFDAGAFERTEDLYGSWVKWCQDTRLSRPFGRQLFTQALSGILVKRRSRFVGRGFAGYQLRRPPA